MDSLESWAVPLLTLSGALGLGWWIVRADYRRRPEYRPPAGRPDPSGRRRPGGTLLDLALLLLAGGALLRWAAGDRFAGWAILSVVAAGAGMVVMGIYLEFRLGAAGRGKGEERGATSSPRLPRGARPSSPSETP